jgi:hypothetical protein
VAQRRGIRRSSVERAATQYPAAEDRPMKHDPKLFDVICVIGNGSDGRLAALRLPIALAKL